MISTTIFIVNIKPFPKSSLDSQRKLYYVGAPLTHTLPAASGIPVVLGDKVREEVGHGFDGPRLS